MISKNCGATGQCLVRNLKHYRERGSGSFAKCIRGFERRGRLLDLMCEKWLPGLALVFDMYYMYLVLADFVMRIGCKLKVEH